MAITSVELLLNTKKQTASNFLTMAEELTGYPSEDVRLSGELAALNRQWIESLGLDPVDTTAQELYHANINAYDRLTRIFDKQIGVKAKISPANKLKLVKQIIAPAQNDTVVWAIKKSVARKLFAQHQPKKLMKMLNYRSVDSMLKREDISMLFAGARIVESPRWQKILRKNYKNLTPNDFETRSSEILLALAERWQKVSNGYKSISRVNEIGALVLWPNSQTSHTPILSLCLMATQQLSDLQAISNWLKLNQFDRQFAKIIQSYGYDAKPPYVKLKNSDVYWLSINSAIASHHNHDLNDSFQNLLSSSELINFDKLYHFSKASPYLNAWLKRGYLIFTDSNGDVVSANILDAAKNHLSRSDFGSHTNLCAKKDIHAKLLARYMKHGNFESLVFESLNYDGLQDYTNVKPVANFTKFGSVRQDRVGAA